MWVKGEPVNGRGTDIPGEIQRRVIMNATYGTRRFACANTSNAFGCIPINLSGMQTRHGMKLLVIGDHRSNRTEGEREREEDHPDRIIRRWLMDTRRERFGNSAIRAPVPFDL